MKIYIVGNITGEPNYKEKFDIAATSLEAQGHIVLNPAELPEGMLPADYMRICFAMIDTATRSTCLRAGIAAPALLSSGTTQCIPASQYLLEENKHEKITI